MHIALRMAAIITREFHKNGPLLNRQTPFRWKDAWYDMTTDFERPHVPETWCSVYANGRVVYTDGAYHPFLDVIEQCDVKNRAEYDRAILIAEDVFKQAGKSVSIDHDVNIAIVIGVMDDKTRCGLILRSPTRTTTFNFQMTLDGEANDTIDPHYGLLIAADYLEAIQLSVTTGFVQAQIHSGKIRETSPLAKKALAAYKRIGRLNQSIQGFENQFDIRYRPERPDFMEILEEAKGLNQKISI
jgi:hypothetical protein